MIQINKTQMITPEANLSNINTNVSNGRVPLLVSFDNVRTEESSQQKLIQLTRQK